MTLPTTQHKFLMRLNEWAIKTVGQRQTLANMQHDPKPIAKSKTYIIIYLQLATVEYTPHYTFIHLPFLSLYIEVGLVHCIVAAAEGVVT